MNLAVSFTTQRRPLCGVPSTERRFHANRIHTERRLGLLCHTVAQESETAVEGFDHTSAELSFQPLSNYEKFWTSCRLFFALPWRRFKKGSVLSFNLSDEIREVRPPNFSRELSLPTICEALMKAAYDPRIKGLFVKIEPVDCGWAKLTEIRRHLEFFNASGKFSVAYMESGGEKEYFVASAFQEIYVPPTANVYLRGLSLSGTFVRGALDKIGIDPQVKRIGNYKSAGDQLLREEMSVYQKEQLQALLDDIYNGFTKEVARSRSMSVESVEKAVDEGYISMEEYLKAGFFTDLKYRDEVISMLKERLGIKEKKTKLKRVSLKRYKSVSPSAFGLNNGRKTVAIVRASGPISGSDGVMSNTGPSINAKELIREIRKAADMKNVVAIVLRIDSPGGEALASDLAWREIQQVAEEKPVVASMADLAASGGYYLAMGAKKIVAEQLTLTGSIGVVLAKIGLGELYKRLGVGKETLSKGRYAELLTDNRSFTEDEDAYFTKLADYAYESFRDKAASSRGLTPEQMQEYAQGRVWSGSRAVEIGLVDAIGGIHRAIEIAKQCADLKDNERVKVLEVSRTKGTPLDMIRSIGLVTNVVISILFLGWGIVSFAISSEGSGLFNAVTSVVLGGAGLLSSIPESDDELWEYTMEDIDVNDSKLEGMLPQAIMDTDNLFLSKSLKPALVQLLKKLL